MKKDIEWLKSWFDDDKSYTGDYVKFKINHYRWGDEAEDEPLYRALVKWHEFVEDEGYFTCKYWKFDTYDGDVFPSNLFSKCGRYLTEMSKSEWSKLGINNSNADFIEVEVLD